MDLSLSKFYFQSKKHESNENEDLYCVSIFIVFYSEQDFSNDAHH